MTLEDLVKKIDGLIDDIHGQSENGDGVNFVHLDVIAENEVSKCLQLLDLARLCVLAADLHQTRYIAAQQMGK